MEIELHQLDYKYERLKVRNRKEETGLKLRRILDIYDRELKRIEKKKVG